LLGLNKGEVTAVAVADTSSSEVNVSESSYVTVAEIEGEVAMAARRQLQCITENMVTEDSTAGTAQYIFETDFLLSLFPCFYYHLINYFLI